MSQQPAPAIGAADVPSRPVGRQPGRRNRGAEAVGHWLLLGIAFALALGIGVGMATSPGTSFGEVAAIDLDDQALRRLDATFDLDDDDDDEGDGDKTRGDDGTNGGNNTGDGDNTRGNDGTNGGNNTGDGDNTRGNDGNNGGNNTGD
jgi:hypothetical protein